MNPKDSSGQGELPSYTEQVSVVLRMLRALFGMSQSDLAKASEVSRPTINRVETLRDVEKVRTGTLEALLAVFRQLGVQLELKEEGLVVALPMSSLIAAIEAGKHKARKEEVMELVLEAQQHMRLNEPVKLSYEDLKGMRVSHSYARPLKDGDDQ